MESKARIQKQRLVSTITQEFQLVKFVLLADYTKLKVSQFQQLRRALLPFNAQLKVYKNTLLKRAWQNQQFASLTQYLTGPRCLVKSNQDGFELLAILVKFSQQFGTLNWLAGVWQDQLLNSTTIQRLGKIPTQPVLYQQLLGTLLTPLHQLHFVLDRIAEQRSTSIKPD